MPSFKPLRSVLARPSLGGPSLAAGLALCVSVAMIPNLAVAGAPPAEASEEAPPSEQEEAPPIDTEARAMEAYQDGKSAYDAGDYDEALQLFLEAQSLYPSPVFHYNVGSCHEALGNYKQAIISFSAYLRSYKSAFGEDPNDKANTENKIARLEEMAAAADKPEPRPEPQPDPQPEPAKPKNPGLALIITGGVLTGVGVGVAAIGGAVSGSQAASISRQLTDVYDNGNPEQVTLAQAQELDTDGKAANLNQILMLSIGSAVAVTGIALLSVGLVKKKKAAAAGATARLIPSFGADGAGLVLSGRF